MSYLAQNTYYTITYYNLQSVFPRRRLHVLAGVTSSPPEKPACPQARAFGNL
jgi:hypothetical protein